MAIDTAAKRRQALSASTFILPLPDGTISAIDRAFLLRSYYQGAQQSLDGIIQIAFGTSSVLATTTGGKARELAMESDTGRLLICTSDGAPFVSPVGGINPPSISGNWGDGTALQSLVSELDSLGIIIDDVTPGSLPVNYLLASEYTAADVLAKLLTVDVDNSGLNATYFQGLAPANFDLAGAAIQEVADHVGLPDPHAQYLLETAYTAADVLAKLLTVDANDSGLNANTLQGYVTTDFALASALSGYARTTGADTMATSQAQTFTNSLVFPSWRPASDTTTAAKIKTAADADFITFDTVNKRQIISGSQPFMVFNGVSFSGFRFQISALDRFTTALDSVGSVIFSRFNSSGTFQANSLTLASDGRVWLGGLPQSGSNPLACAILATTTGTVSVGQSSTPTAWLDIAASTTARASIRIQTGVAPTSPNAGDMWTDGADFYGRGAASYSWGATVRTTAIRPLADSTTALQLQNAAGSVVSLNVDTTNNRTIVGAATYASMTGVFAVTKTSNADITFETAMEASYTVSQAATEACGLQFYGYSRPPTGKTVGLFAAGFYSINHTAAGTSTALEGIQVRGIINNGAVGSVYGFRFRTFTQSGGTTSNLYGFHFTAPTISGAGAITNMYGIYVANVSGAGTLNYALYTNAGDVRLMASNSDKIGFHGVTPVARQLLATGAGASVDDVITLLQNLGLARQS